MFCPGCGAGISRHDETCSGCNADLTLARRRVTKTTTLKQRQQPVQLLLARHEAARLRIPQQSAVESPEQFVERVRDAVTQDLDDRARAMTVNGIGARG